MMARASCVLLLFPWLWSQRGFAETRVRQHIGKPFVLHHINRALHRRAAPERCLKTYAFSIRASEILTENRTTFKSIIDGLLDNGRYDNTIRPLFDTVCRCVEFKYGLLKYMQRSLSWKESGRPERVEVDVVLNTLGPISERDMEMTTSFYLRQQWRDPRLDFSALSNQTISLNHRRLDSLWLPDLYFSQAKTERTHDVTVPNVLIRLHPDGTVLYSQRLTVTFQCIMDLRKFPLDEQTCYIRMESYSHTTEDLYFVWSLQRKSMDKTDTADLPDFALQEITTHDCSATYATGTFTCLEARLKLQRQIGFYMLHLYVPCILITTLSWVSFWLDPQAIPARISVGLLTVLTITTQSSGSRSELPRVPYTKAVDIWLSLCLVFVFAAYMQYAIVTVFSRAHRKLQFVSPSSDTENSSLANSQTSVITRSSDSIGHMDSVTHKRNTPRKGSVSNGSVSNKVQAPNTPDTDSTSIPNGRQRRPSLFQLDHGSRDFGRVVDKWSRTMFPLAFVAFNVGYWVFYSYRPDRPENDVVS